MLNEGPYDLSSRDNFTFVPWLSASPSVKYSIFKFLLYHNQWAKVRKRGPGLLNEYVLEGEIIKNYWTSVGMLKKFLKKTHWIRKAEACVEAFSGSRDCSFKEWSQEKNLVLKNHWTRKAENLMESLPCRIHLKCLDYVSWVYLTWASGKNIWRSC